MGIPSKFKTTILIGLAIFLALQRLATYHEPAEWDAGMYSVIGHEMNLGARLYQGIWDMKPPAIFATYAAAERVAGNGPRQLYFLSVLAAVITMLGVYAAASVRGPVAGLWAAALWSAAAFDVASGASLPNTEVFINAAMIWALAIMMRMNGPQRSWLMTMLAGMLMALASLYKTVVIAPAALLAVGHILSTPAPQRRRALMQAVLMGLIGMAAWGLTFGYFAITGRRWIFIATNVSYARFYGGNVGAHVLESLKPWRLFPSQLVSLAPLAAAGLLALFLGPRKRPSRPTLLLILMAIGTQIAIAATGTFWDHYYQLWMPMLAVAGGWGLIRLGELTQPRHWPQRALGGALVVALVWPQVRWYGLSSDDWAQQRHGGLFYDCYVDAKRIELLLEPNEKLYLWTDEPWIYWLTRHRPAAAAMFKVHSLEGPVATWLAERTAEQLRRDPPELLVDWPVADVPPDHPVWRVIEELYRPAPELQAKSPLVFYVRKGGRLDHREPNRH